MRPGGDQTDEARDHEGKLMAEGQRSRAARSGNVDRHATGSRKGAARTVGAGGPRVGVDNVSVRRESADGNRPNQDEALERAELEGLGKGARWRRAEEAYDAEQARMCTPAYRTAIWLSELFARHAERLKTSRRDSRDVVWPRLEREVFGIARSLSESEQLFLNSESKAAKLRALVRGVRTHAFGIKNWRGEAYDDHVSPAELLKEDADGINEDVAQAVRETLREFGLLYPLEAAKIEVTALARAIMTWRDRDPGARDSARKFGKYVALSRAIGSTSFAASDAEVKNVNTELRDGPKPAKRRGRPPRNRQ